MPSMFSHHTSALRPLLRLGTTPSLCTTFCVLHTIHYAVTWKQYFRDYAAIPMGLCHIRTIVLTSPNYAGCLKLRDSALQLHDLSQNHAEVMILIITQEICGKYVVGYKNLITRLFAQSTSSQNSGASVTRKRFVDFGNDFADPERSADHYLRTTVLNKSK